MKKPILIIVGLAFLVTKSNSQTVTDYDGNIYNTVTIGTQVWLKENLKVTHYRNGDSIPNIKIDTTWTNLRSGAYCDYNNSSDTSLIYGRLYNWFAINDIRNVAPVGWHVATDSDWTVLTNYLGGSSVAGGKIKEIGFSHWSYPNTGATNESGFTALPGGQRLKNGNYGNIRNIGRWWSSTERDSNNAFFQDLDFYYTSFGSNFYDKFRGFSVRCLRDISAQIDETNLQENIDIYPNPATDKLSINSSTRQTLKMQVFNTVGQCILQTELNNNTNTVDISSLTKGIYILKLTSPNGTFEKKIIKE